MVEIDRSPFGVWGPESTLRTFTAAVPAGG
jgi:hypothetical protein